jgi:hypothetical protein
VNAAAVWRRALGAWLCRSFGIDQERDFMIECLCGDMLLLRCERSLYRIVSFVCNSV